MESDDFHYPRRFPLNAPGPFYTTGGQRSSSNQPSAERVWTGDCLSCEAPEAEAPELLAPLDDNNSDTYFLRQPSTPEEVQHACWALGVCCVAALRYGGQDRSIIRRLGNDPELCDYIEMSDGTLRLTVGPDGELLPFAQRIRDEERRRRRKKWWQFWR